MSGRQDVCRCPLESRALPGALVLLPHSCRAVRPHLRPRPHQYRLLESVRGKSWGDSGTPRVLKPPHCRQERPPQLTGGQVPLRHRWPSRPRLGRAGPADGRAELILAGDPAANWQRGAGGPSWAALRQDKVTLACRAALNAGAVRSTSGVWG